MRWLIALMLLVLVSASLQLQQGYKSLTPRLLERDIGDLPMKGLTDADYAAKPLRRSGYFRLNRTMDAHMFYFYFQQRSMDTQAPVVLWMTGGPGCSSELAVFYENGPYHINKDLTTSENAYGWDVAADMIYVDQPINTGFSWSEDPRDTVHDEVGVADDMLDFLTELWQAHPELNGRDFYVTGESYAGHYVPAVSRRVYDAIKSGEVADDTIVLRGFAIGNGLTDPGIQYGAYADFAFLKGMITEDERERVLATFPPCSAAISLCNGHKWKAECLLAVQYCQASQVEGTLMYASQRVGYQINIYDVRKPCVGPLCYDFSRMEAYLNQPAVREALGVGDREWEECNMEVYQDMQGDWMLDYATVVPPMLEDGVHVLIYAGDEDFICNFVGNERWVANLTWSSKPPVVPSSSDWLVDGEQAGRLTNYGAIEFLQIYEAGHMVPMDQPKHALDMFTKFVTGQPLVPEQEELTAAQASA